MIEPKDPRRNMPVMYQRQVEIIEPDTPRFYSSREERLQQQRFPHLNTARAPVNSPKSKASRRKTLLTVINVLALAVALIVFFSNRSSNQNTLDHEGLRFRLEAAPLETTPAQQAIGIRVSAQALVPTPEAKRGFITVAAFASDRPGAVVFLELPIPEEAGEQSEVRGVFSTLQDPIPEAVDGASASTNPRVEKRILQAELEWGQKKITLRTDAPPDKPTEAP